MQFEIEEQLINAFVLPERKERSLILLKYPKKRSKFLNALDHFSNLDLRFCHQFDKPMRSAEQIEKTLKSKGAPAMCYIISSNGKLDGREIDLSEALKQVVGGQFGTFISCIPGKLGYFEGEYGERYLLERDK